MNTREIANHITRVGDDGHGFFDPVFKEGVVLERDWVAAAVDAKADAYEDLRAMLDGADFGEVVGLVFNAGLALAEKIFNEQCGERP